MTAITNRSSAESISEILKEMKPKGKGISMNKFGGKISWKGNALAVQQQVRNDR